MLRHTCGVFDTEIRFILPDDGLAPIVRGLRLLGDEPAATAMGLQIFDTAACTLADNGQSATIRPDEDADGAPMLRARLDSQLDPVTLQRDRFSAVASVDATHWLRDCLQRTHHPTGLPLAPDDRLACRASVRVDTRRAVRHLDADTRVAIVLERWQTTAPRPGGQLRWLRLTLLGGSVRLFFDEASRWQQAFSLMIDPVLPTISAMRLSLSRRPWPDRLTGSIGRRDPDDPFRSLQATLGDMVNACIALAHGDRRAMRRAAFEHALLSTRAQLSLMLTPDDKPLIAIANRLRQSHVSVSAGLHRQWVRLELRRAGMRRESVGKALEQAFERADEVDLDFGRLAQAVQDGVLQVLRWTVDATGADQGSQRCGDWQSRVARWRESVYAMIESSARAEQTLALDARAEQRVRLLQELTRLNIITLDPAGDPADPVLPATVGVLNEWIQHDRVRQWLATRVVDESSGVDAHRSVDRLLIHFTRKAAAADSRFIDLRSRLLAQMPVGGHDDQSGRVNVR